MYILGQGSPTFLSEGNYFNSEWHHMLFLNTQTKEAYAHLKILLFTVKRPLICCITTDQISSPSTAYMKVLRHSEIFL